jgi:hypothetical protein
MVIARMEMVYRNVDKSNDMDNNEGEIWSLNLEPLISCKF